MINKNFANYINEDITNGFSDIFLEIFSLIAIFFTIYVIITKNPIVSVLHLIGLFATISLILLTLGMNYIGLSYLLVYVGAISILFLFILMLLNIRVSELHIDGYNSIPLTIIVAMCIANVFLKVSPGYFMFNGFFSYNKVKFVSYENWQSYLLEHSHIQSIGSIIYTNFGIWIVIISVILLLSMIGAIIITIPGSNKSTNNDINFKRFSDITSYIASSNNLYRQPIILQKIDFVITAFNSSLYFPLESMNRFIYIIIDTITNIIINIYNFLLYILIAIYITLYNLFIFFRNLGIILIKLKKAFYWKNINQILTKVNKKLSWKNINIIVNNVFALDNLKLIAKLILFSGIIRLIYYLLLLAGCSNSILLLIFGYIIILVFNKAEKKILYIIKFITVISCLNLFWCNVKDITIYTLDVNSFYINNFINKVSVWLINLLTDLNYTLNIISYCDSPDDDELDQNIMENPKISPNVDYNNSKSKAREFLYYGTRADPNSLSGDRYNYIKQFCDEMHNNWKKLERIFINNQALGPNIIDENWLDNAMKSDQWIRHGKHFYNINGDKSIQICKAIGIELIPFKEYRDIINNFNVEISGKSLQLWKGVLTKSTYYCKYDMDTAINHWLDQRLNQGIIGDMRHHWVIIGNGSGPWSGSGQGAGGWQGPVGWAGNLSFIQRDITLLTQALEYYDNITSGKPCTSFSYKAFKYFANQYVHDEFCLNMRKHVDYTNGHIIANKILGELGLRYKNIAINFNIWLNQKAIEAECNDIYNYKNFKGDFAKDYMEWPSETWYRNPFGRENVKDIKDIGDLGLDPVYQTAFLSDSWWDKAPMPHYDGPFNTAPINDTRYSHYIFNENYRFHLDHFLKMADDIIEKTFNQSPIMRNIITSMIKNNLDLESKAIIKSKIQTEASTISTLTSHYENDKSTKLTNLLDRNVRNPEYLEQHFSDRRCITADSSCTEHKWAFRNKDIKVYSKFEMYKIGITGDSSEKFTHKFHQRYIGYGKVVNIYSLIK